MQIYVFDEKHLATREKATIGRKGALRYLFDKDAGPYF